MTMKTLPYCLGLVLASERELAGAYGLLADRHSREFDVYQGCKLFAQWSRSHLQTLEPFIERHGRAVNSDPERVRSALFHGMRVGGFGLLRDLQDLLLLVHQARTTWTALQQAAKELRDLDMVDATERCATEIDRQIDWVCTHVKLVAPQALTVPPNLTDEAKGSVPKHPTPAGLPDLVWSPLAAGVAILSVGVIGLLVGKPWLLPSLGPTAFLMAEMPEHPSSRFYNTVAGHFLGLAAGFLSVAVFSAWTDPVVLDQHVLSGARVGAAVLAIVVLMLGSLLSKATHPPAAATALLVALGSLKSWSDAINVMIGAALIGVLGILLRKLRARAATSLSKDYPAEVPSATLPQNFHRA